MDKSDNPHSTVQFLVSAGQYVIWILFFAGIGMAVYFAYIERLNYIQSAIRIIELARAMKEEEVFLKDKAFVILFRSNQTGRWYGKRLNGSAELKELRGVNDHMPVEEIFKTGRRRYADCEVAVAACVWCGTLTDSDDGSFNGEAISGRYEFKKNRLEFRHAYGAYICHACKKPENNGEGK